MYNNYVNSSMGVGSITVITLTIIQSTLQLHYGILRFVLALHTILSSSDLVPILLLLCNDKKTLNYILMFIKPSIVNLPKHRKT